MGRLALFALFGALTFVAAANAQPASAPRPAPKDHVIRGEFTPDRVKADQEAAANKRLASGQGPAARGRAYYFAWGSMEPAEFEALGRNIVFLIATWTQKADEIPVKRVYLHTETGDIAVRKISSWKTSVEPDSATAKMYGSNREDGFYLVPGSALLRKGQLHIELGGKAGDLVMLELPSTVASAAPNRFANLDPAPNGKIDLKALQNFVRRKFPGFTVPSSLP
jgi:hypothetical protein